MKHKIFVLIIFAVLFLCAASYLFPFLRMESSENRTMATFDMVLHPEEDSVVYSESPVERLDAALSDQFPFREAVVKKYLALFDLSENITYSVARSFSKHQDDQYILHSVGNYELIEDTGYIMECPSTEPLDASVIQSRMEQLERIHDRYPDIKMYEYYVTQASDMPWFNSYLGTAAVDHYQEISSAAPGYLSCGHLVYRDLDDYMDTHFKTDHHWNHRGAERGYEDIYAMMDEDIDLGPLYLPVNEERVSETYDFDYLGSYGNSLGGLYDEGYDDFFFYDHGLPTRELSAINIDTMEEFELAKTGLYDEYKRGEINTDTGEDHYIRLYGVARDQAGNEYEDSDYPFVIRNSEGNGMNLLITGDSYARAVRDPLAADFDTTVYLDYRTLSKVPIDYIIERYDIDVLLICSHTYMWRTDEYLYTFMGDE